MKTIFKIKLKKSQKLAGDDVERKLSDKAQWYYSVTDPCNIAVVDDKYIVYERESSIPIHGCVEFDSIDELNEYFESMADEVGYNERCE